MHRRLAGVAGVGLSRNLCNGAATEDRQSDRKPAASSLLHRGLHHVFWIGKWRADWPVDSDEAATERIGGLCLAVQSVSGKRLTLYQPCMRLNRTKGVSTSLS